jgi:hypothetical protein
VADLPVHLADLERNKWPIWPESALLQDPAVIIVFLIYFAFAAMLLYFARKIDKNVQEEDDVKLKKLVSETVAKVIIEMGKQTPIIQKQIGEEKINKNENLSNKNKRLKNERNHRNS